MMMEKKQISFPRYEHYKDSGIDWIGDIPEHWAVKRLGSLFSERREIVSDVDYPPLSVTMKGIVPQLDTAAKSQDSNNRKLVCVGDFVINSRSDRKGSSGISLLQGSVSLINTVLRPKGIYSSYTNYLLKSYVFIEEYYRIGRGIVADLWTTRYNEMKNIMIAIPPLPEQTAIAQFLDHKTAQIDRAIAIKEAQIKLLNERKQIMIQEAVTKGLDPSVPMKDSGIEWIGEIPAHWEVNKLKYQTSLISDRLMANESDLKFIGMENIESWSGKYLPKNEDIAEGLAGYFQKGDLLFGKLRPYLAKVYLATEEGLCSTEFNIYRCEANSSARYYQYLFLSYKFIDLISSSTYGARMPRASSSFIGEQYLPVPAYDEQQQIVTILDEYCNKIAKGIHLFKTQIQTLKEYKTTLINEAVTGKIKIH